MLNQSTQSIIIFTICVVALLILFCSFIVTMIYRYQKKQHSFYKELEELKIAHEIELLRAQLEMQEFTFQNISREIHDNIGQKLSLAKLYLNTFKNNQQHLFKIADSIDILTETISDLSNIARSMSSEIILSEGLRKGIEFEVRQLKKIGTYHVTVELTGDEAFLDIKKEIIVFRIFQEAIHNILKHADATAIHISMHYYGDLLSLTIADNGKGFNKEGKKEGTGLSNMRNRAILLNGTSSIDSNSRGTQLTIIIPTEKYDYA